VTPSAEQRAIVAAAQRRGAFVVMLAGAGTGKTTTLVAVINSWLTRPNPARRVSVLTFSRDAADELKRRLAHHGKTKVAVSTFDALLTHLVRRERPGARFVGSEEDCRYLHEALVAAHGSDLLRLCPDGLDIAVAQLHRALQTGTPLAPDYAALLAPARARFLAEKRRRSLYSSADLRRLCLDNIDVVAADITATGDCLVVDEAQDCEPAEVALLARVARTCRHIVVAHDPNQNVVRFRGAVPDLRKCLDDVGVTYTTCALTVNRRSTRRIVAMCAAFLASQGLDVLVDAAPDAPLGDKPRLVITADRAAMLHEIAAGLLSCRGVTPFADTTHERSAAARERLGLPKAANAADIVLIVRTNHQAAAVVRYLLDASIPAAQYAAPKNPYDTKVMARLWAWCAPTLNGQDGTREPSGRWALTTLVSAILRRNPAGAGLGARETAVERLVAAINDLATTGLPFTEIRRRCLTEIGEVVAEGGHPYAVHGALDSASTMLSRWIELDETDATPADRVRALLRFFPDYAGRPVRDQTTKGERKKGRAAWHPAARLLASIPPGEGRLERGVRQLLELGGRHKPPVSLETFRADIEASFGSTPVIVMTAHKAKGREAEHVIVPFADDGIWPLDRRRDPGLVIDEEDLADEEACLCYVAASRAKSTLALVSSGVPTRYIESQVQGHWLVIHVDGTEGQTGASA
jgi:superfamily I DNA/RNA helicase